ADVNRGFGGSGVDRMHGARHEPDPHHRTDQELHVEQGRECRCPVHPVFLAGRRGVRCGRGGLSAARLQGRLDRLYPWRGILCRCTPRGRGHGGRLLRDQQQADWRKTAGGCSNLPV
ncbi:hypothetical protein, partial [Pseudomonas sp. FEN]